MTQEEYERIKSKLIGILNQLNLCNEDLEDGKVINCHKRITTIKAVDITVLLAEMRSMKN